MPFEPAWQITPRLLRQIKAVERTAGFLEAVELRPDWMAEVKRTVRVLDALSSVQIEGSTLTLEAAFQLAQAQPACALSPSEEEFLNYLAAFEAIDALRGVRDYSPSRRDLCNLHALIVRGVRGGDRYAGEIRREEVQVGDVDGAVTVIHHRPPPPEALEALLDDLFAWLELSKGKPKPAQIARGRVDPWVHPVLAAGIAHHRLVWIHPFVDGNGRTTRIFTALLLYQRGYDFKHLFDLSTYYNRDRDAYYAALRTADTTGDLTAWLEYFVGGLSFQMMGIVSKARKAALGIAAADATEEPGE